MSATTYGTEVWSDENFTPAGISSGPMSPSGLSTSFESESVRRWSDRLAELIRLRSLRDDWDGEGAQAPQPEVVNSMEVLLIALRDQGYPSPSAVVASHRGHIVIEWQLEGGVYVEAECSSPYRAEWMYEFPNAPVVHEESAWSPPAVRRGHYRFYQAA